jgi:hypothetical protein
MMLLRIFENGENKEWTETKAETMEINGAEGGERKELRFNIRLL